MDMIPDPRALIAAVRKGDEGALRQAYETTFGNELGRLVLAHHLSESGVGGPLGRGEDLQYRAGMHDGALALAMKAGFDQATIATAVLTDNLEGDDNETGEFQAPGVVADEDDLAFS